MLEAGDHDLAVALCVENGLDPTPLGPSGLDA
jgi:hypothetical protein